MFLSVSFLSYTKKKNKQCFLIIQIQCYFVMSMCHVFVYQYMLIYLFFFFFLIKSEIYYVRV